MGSRRHHIHTKLNQVLDGALLGVVFWLSHVLRYGLGQRVESVGPIATFEHFLWLLAVIVLVSPIVLEFQGFYNHPLRKQRHESARQVFRSLLWMALIFGACVVFFKWTSESRAVLLMFIAFGGLALLAKVEIVKWRLSRRCREEGHKERIVLAGASADMAAVLAGMPTEQRMAVEVVDRIDLSERPVSDLAKCFREKAIERVVFAADHVHFRVVEEAIQICEIEGVEAWLAADFMRTTISRLNVEELGETPVLVFRSTPENGWALMCKEVSDRLLALVLIVLSAPIWLAAMIGVKLASSNGPVIFRQQRSGRYGLPFTMYKFRTMDIDAEARRAELAEANQMSGPVFKVDRDPRIFAFGSLLRKLSIDELPQLWNVVRGEMSLVGPRPLPVYEVEQIENSAQRRRLSVKPGLTCLWQISGRSAITDFNDWVQLDLEYIDNWSLWLDWKILVRTVPVVLLGAGAR
jgi:exopolysaccharide biosynthesis polyprenyl glycosylphosphotransferase